MNRTLVKTPPELWSEFSEVGCLANHLGEFGEISISRLVPQRTVAWEGEHACGTVELEASEKGTRVTMKAEVRGVESPVPLRSPTVERVVPDLEAWDRSAAEIEFHAGWQTDAAQRAAARAVERARRGPKGGPLRRLFRGRRNEPDEPPAGPSPLPPPADAAPASGGRRGDEPPRSGPAVGVAGVSEERALAVLETALDNLGARPRF